MRKVIVLVLLLLFSGCARNTNSVAFGGTGFFVKTPLIWFGVGNFEAHVATSDLAEEQLVITDTKYFNGDAAEADGAVVQTQRSYSMEVHPTEDADPSWEDLK